MPIFPKPVRPSRAIADFFGFFIQRRRHQIVYAAAAVGATTLVLAGVYNQFTAEKQWVPPDIVYVEQWSANRTEADIRAQQAIDGPRELAERKAREAAALKRQREYQKLAKQLGI